MVRIKYCQIAEKVLKLSSQILIILLIMIRISGSHKMILLSPKIHPEPGCYPSMMNTYPATKTMRIIGTEEVGKQLKDLGNDLTSILLIDGQIAGTWKREMGKDIVSIRISLLKDLDDVQRSAVDEEALKYGEFFEKMVQLSFDRS